MIRDPSLGPGHGTIAGDGPRSTSGNRRGPAVRARATLAPQDRAGGTHPIRGALSQREKVNVAASRGRTTKRGMVTTPYAYRDSLNHATRVSVASRKPISEVISLCSSVTTPEATSPMFSSASPVSQITSRPIRRAEATVTEADSLARPGGDSANSTRYPSAVSEDSWASNHARKASSTLPPTVISSATSRC
jgi:hypothetical protein